MRSILFFLTVGLLMVDMMVVTGCASSSLSYQEFRSKTIQNLNHSDSIKRTQSAVSGDSCSWSTDCDFGKVCRDRGDGIKSCLGNGTAGDYCGLSADCNLGMKCQSQSPSAPRVCAKEF
jgi:hypothetical protein